MDIDQKATRFSDDELIDVDSVLDALVRDDLEAATVVRPHLFAGMSIEETATALNVSRATA